MTRRVVCMPGLRLECEEHCHPLLRRRDLQHQSTVLPDTVVTQERRNIALIHMNIVHAVSRLKAEYLILGGFWSPALTEGINGRISFLNCPADVMFQLIAQIVVGTRQAWRKQPHIK